jgi:hypothetical protein
MRASGLAYREFGQRTLGMAPKATVLTEAPPMAIIVGILILHAASMACLWALARYSVTLVDEQGVPVARGAWTEHVVPRHATSRKGHSLR